MKLQLLIKAFMDTLQFYELSDENNRLQADIC
jgi:hypothetical protein